MGLKPFKVCSKHLCNALTKNRDGRCDEHAIVRKRAPKPSHAMYNTLRWRAYSKRFRTYHAVCINHATCHGMAEVTDHIHPVEEGGDFWDQANHQAMCHFCHNQKRGKEGAIKRATQRGGGV